MRRTVLTIAISGLLAGCATLQPAYERPLAPIPAGWPVDSPELTAREVGLAQLDWRQVFRDPGLQRLIAAGLANNRDLRSAIANIRVARAQYRIERSDRLPDVTASAGANFSRGRRVSAASGTGMNGDTPIAGSGSGLSAYYTADVGTTAFEIDLFGRVASLSEAALDEYLTTEAAARSVRISLIGEIARAWATRAADAELLAIAQDTVDSADKSVRLTRARLEGGVAPRTDLRQAETVLYTAQSDLASARTAVIRDTNALRLLTGGEPAAADLPGGTAVLGEALGPVPAGLDSSILLRRPDVIASEYRLRSANARIGAARAALFPRISLTGLLGLASTALTGLFSGDAFTAVASPGVSVPIFDGGARRGGVDLARAQRDALIEDYQGTIQIAFREVSDALATRSQIGARLVADSDLVAATADNYRLADARYRGGIDNFLASLDAQRTLYNARRGLVGTQLADAVSLADLFVALGDEGGGPTGTVSSLSDQQ